MQVSVSRLMIPLTVALFCAVPMASHAEEKTKTADAKTPAKTGAAPKAKKTHKKTAHGEAGPITATKHDVDLAVWSLIVFIVFVIALKKLAWEPLSKALDQRESNIRGDLAAAEESRIKAEKMLEAHQAKLDGVQDEVREILAEARRDADHTKQEIIETAQREAEATRQRAVSEIERARDAALQELFEGVASQVAAATEHVIGRSLTGDDHNRLIDEALTRISERN